MFIPWKNILISFYKVDMEKTPFNPDVGHYTLKRFADLALAQYRGRTPLKRKRTTPHPSPEHPPRAKPKGVRATFEEHVPRRQNAAGWRPKLWLLPATW
jgi:hypothetical protein